MKPPKHKDYWGWARDFDEYSRRRNRRPYPASHMMLMGAGPSSGGSFQARQLNPVAYYGWNANTTTDDTGNGWTLTPFSLDNTNFPVRNTGVPSILGSNVLFHRANKEELDVSGQLLANPFSQATLAFWWYPTAISNAQFPAAYIITGKGLGLACGLGALSGGFSADGTILFDINAGINTTLTLYEVNKWNFMAFVFDGSLTDVDPATQDFKRAKIYKNGVQVPFSELSSSSPGSVPATLTQTTTPVLRWGRSVGSTTYIDGYLDEGQLYPTALTASQITQLYGNGTPGGY